MLPKEVKTEEKVATALQEVVISDGTVHLRIEPDIVETLSKKDIIDLINQLRKELSYRD